MSEQTEGAEVWHRGDCPTMYFTDKPERCRCAILDALDELEARAAVVAARGAEDGGEDE